MFRIGFKMRVLIICILCFTESFGEIKIKYAAVIYRHGDRTPVDLYPTDPWKNESLWPVRFGELTNIGKNQHYALGKWLKKRYSGLISDKFDPKEVYIRSTDVDRTLMSAQTNLAGMYPPFGTSIWKSDLMWQPIPIHTRPEKDDEVLAMKRKCVPYNSEKVKHKQSKAYRERLSKYQGLMDYLTAYTGKKIKDYDDINDIYNVLYIESLYNFTLPAWTQSIYPNKLKEPACYSFRTATATPLMARLMVGPLLKEIVGKMNTIVLKKKRNPIKLSIYSGHDFTIGNILSAIGVYDGMCPVYTSSIFFELFQDSTSMEYSVRMSYRNSTEIVEPHVIYIPHCGKMCPFDRFVKLYDNLITVDWINDCSNPIMAIVAAAFLVGIFVIIFTVRKTRLEMTRVQFAYTSVYNPTAVPEKNIV